MRFRQWATTSVCLLTIFFAAVTLASAAGEHSHEHKSTGAEPHHSKDWRFSMPKGDPVKGRAVFRKFECYYCHEVRGEDFPYPTDSAPELSQMGPLHQSEFFAESILNPDAVVGRNYRSQDGKSPMTDFTDKMTVRELIDVSAYVASLRPKGPAKTVSADGWVVAVIEKTGEVVLEHREIKGFMDAMTRGYKITAPSLLRGIRSGDRVRFTIDTESRAITKIDKLK